MSKKHERIDECGGFREGICLKTPKAGRFQAEFDEALPLLKERLGKKRFTHVIGVAGTARKMAKAYGVDPDLATITGLLHDWDKCYNDEEVYARAREFQVELTDDEQRLGSIVHAKTGAEATRRLFPQLPAEVFRAIELHTTGCAEMTPLEMVIFSADLLEPSRMLPQYDALRNSLGRLPLEDVYLACYEGTMVRLAQRHSIISRSTCETWNLLIEQEAQRAQAMGMNQKEYRGYVDSLLKEGM